MQITDAERTLFGEFRMHARELLSQFLAALVTQNGALLAALEANLPQGNGMNEQFVEVIAIEEEVLLRDGDWDDAESGEDRVDFGSRLRNSVRRAAATLVFYLLATVQLAPSEVSMVLPKQLLEALNEFLGFDAGTPE